MKRNNWLPEAFSISYQEQGKSPWCFWQGWSSLWVQVGSSSGGGTRELGAATPSPLGSATFLPASGPRHCPGSGQGFTPSGVLRQVQSLGGAFVVLAGQALLAHNTAGGRK